MLRKVGYWVLNAFSILLLGANLSSAQDAYFNGKTIRILAGFPSGGGVDAEGRMLARFLAPHISGKSDGRRAKHARGWRDSRKQLV